MFYLGKYRKVTFSTETVTFFSCALNPVYEILPNNGHEVDLTA